jgi:ankyrin repeat protein
VGQGSASIDGYYPIELSCDHFTINKYDTLSDGNLQLIISELTEMLDKAMERCPMPSPAPISLWSPNDAQSINSQPSPDQMVRRTNTAPPIQGHPPKAQLPYRTEGNPYAPSLVSYNSRASSNSGTGDQSERDLRQQAMYRPSNANLSNAYSPPQQDMHPQKQDMYSQQETRPQPDIYSQQWMYPPREIVAEDSISSRGHSSVSGYDGYNARNEAYRSPTTTVHIQGVCTCPECTNTREKDERRMTIMSQLKLKYGSDPVPQERQWKQDLIVNSPLYAAVFFSDPGLVHELLHCGEDLNFQDERVPSGTVLQLAAFKGDEAMVKLLVAHGALIDQEGGEYGSALQAAASEGHVNTVRMLLELNDESDMEPLDLNRQTGSTKTALQAAAAAGHTEIVRILLEQDLDVDQSDAQHESALHQAAANNHLEAIELLLGKGAEILLPGPSGSALDNAIYQGHEEAAMMLLAGGAKIDVDNDKSAVAMKHALKYNHRGVVNLILSHDAHKDAKIKKLEEHPVVQVPSPRNVPTGLSSRQSYPSNFDAS